MPDIKPWGKDRKGNIYHQCVKCGINETKHKGHGLCYFCYNKHKHFNNENRCIECKKIISDNAIRCNSCSSKINKWAINYDKCIECGTIEIKHYSKGLCRKCYNRIKMKEYLKGYKSPKKICIKCHEFKEHFARNLCQKCYFQRPEQKEKDRIRSIVYFYKNHKRAKKRRREYMREYRKNLLNRKKQKLYDSLPERKLKRKEYMKSAKGKASNRNHIYKRKIKLKGLCQPIDVPYKIQERILMRDKICVYCNSNQDLTFDHIISINKGGNNFEENLVIACNPCNGKKRDKDVFEWCKEQNIEIPKIVIELLNRQNEQQKLGELL